MGRSGRPLKWHICEVRKRICEDRNRLSGRAWCVRLPFVRALPSALGCVLCAACLGACVCRSFVGSPCAGRHHKASCFFCETTEARLLGMLSFCFLAPTKPPISDLEHVGTVTFLGNARKQGPLRHFFFCIPWRWPRAAWDFTKFRENRVHYGIFFFCIPWRWPSPQGIMLLL